MNGEIDITTAYETGYRDGESSLWADFACLLDEQGEEAVVAYIKQRIESGA